MGFWAGYAFGVLTCCALSAVTFVGWLRWGQANTMCCTCNKHFNSDTHSLGCPHGRRRKEEIAELVR